MALGKWFGKKDTKPGESTTPAAVQPDDKKRGRFAGLMRGLKKTRDRISSGISAILPIGRKLDDEAIDDIEDMLIQADFGPGIATALTDQLRQAYKEREFERDDIVPFLEERLVARLGTCQDLNWASSGPTVILVAGVNGTGKTTSIAKLSNLFHTDGKKVVLGAADTFRAAAVEQLAIWSERVGVEMVRGAEGGDPSAVVFDAITRAVDGKADVVIIDTAGRLHTEKNLMAQLTKMVRVIQKRIPDGPHEVLQVLDATVGQNAIQQAHAFQQAIEVTGLVLTKLDGTARGGVIFPILDQVGLPVKFIGVGEGIDDLQRFEPDAFVKALFE